MLSAMPFLPVQALSICYSQNLQKIGLVCVITLASMHFISVKFLHKKGPLEHLGIISIEIASIEIAVLMVSIFSDFLP